MTIPLFLAALLVGVFIVLLSTVETAALRLSKVTLRGLAEEDEGRTPLLAKLALDRNRFLIPLQFGSQGLIVGLVALVWFQVGNLGLPNPLLWTIVATILLVALTRQLIPRLLSYKDPESLLLSVLPLSAGFYALLRVICMPLLMVLNAGERLFPSEEEDDTQEEPSDAEIQAYLDVGEEDGIFEEKESELIQSALEFGTTLVREIMTPRNEIVAIQDTATMQELKDLIVDMKFSRIPVYRDNLEQIIGVVYVRNLLAFLDEPNAQKPITPLLKNTWFIPETKKVSELLKEMQKDSESMAIVVNEYGSICGLVTIEDVIEEIVGEIYDEDESQTVDLKDEGDGSFIVLGGMEIEDLEQALGVDLGESVVTTMSGLVVDFLGEVPAAGTDVSINALKIEVLEADRKKIHSMRISREGESSRGDSPEANKENNGAQVSVQAED